MAEIADSAARAASDVWVVVARLRRRLKELAGTAGVTPAQASVLRRLHRDGPASASALAAAEGIRPQSMAATLTALQHQGLLRRDPDPDDGRRQLVTLTDTGRQTATGDHQARQAWLTQAMHDHYTEAERTVIIEAMTLLERLVT
jgi:DNA-binding MarR family transcriptional regulator